MITWTNRMQDDVVRMVGEKMTFSEIAKAIGRGATRSSISSQVRRMKDSGKLNARSIAGATSQRKAIRAKAKKVAKAFPPPKPVRPAPPPPVNERGFGAPAGTGISIVDLRSAFITQCRWPFECDDGETRYCGAPATDGSWCAAHGARVFVSASRPAVDAEYVPRRREARAWGMS